MDNRKYVELINDLGEMEKLIIEASFHIDDTKYAILTKENSDEGMVYSVVENQNNELIFNIVDDPEELKEVIEIYEGIADDII